MSENKISAEKQAELQELASSRFEAVEQEYETVSNLLETVSEDQSLRLPYVPRFYRTKDPVIEQEYLQKQLPKVEQARIEQYCLETCYDRSGECIKPCTEFAKEAFDIGRSLFAQAHKPYAYSRWQYEEW